MYVLFFQQWIVNYKKKVYRAQAKALGLPSKPLKAKTKIRKDRGYDCFRSKRLQDPGM